MAKYILVLSSCSDFKTGSFDQSVVFKLVGIDCIFLSKRSASFASAINTVKRVKKQTLVNKLRKNKYKSALRKIHKLIEKKDTKKIEEYFPIFQSELMKIAKTGIVKKKNLSKKISKISKRIKHINN